MMKLEIIYLTLRRVNLQLHQKVKIILLVKQNMLGIIVIGLQMRKLQKDILFKKLHMSMMIGEMLKKRL